MATPDEYYAQLAAQKKAEAVSQPYHAPSTAGSYSPPGGASLSSPVCPPQQPGGGPEGYSAIPPGSISSPVYASETREHARSPPSAGYGSPPGVGYAQSPPVFHVQQQAPDEVCNYPPRLRCCVVSCRADGPRG